MARLREVEPDPDDLDAERVELRERWLGRCERLSVPDPERVLAAVERVRAAWPAPRPR